MADQEIEFRQPLGALRVVLIISALVFFVLASVSLYNLETLHKIIHWYQTKTSGQEQAIVETIHFSIVGVFLIRIGAISMACFGLLCLMAAISPLKHKGTLLVLILLGLFTGTASVVLGRQLGLNLLFYVVFALIGVLFAVLLLALFPYGRNPQPKEPSE